MIPRANSGCVYAVLQLSMGYRKIIWFSLETLTESKYQAISCSKIISLMVDICKMYDITLFLLMIEYFEE